MKDLQKLIGKTVSEIRFDSDNPFDILIVFTDGTRFYIVSEHNWLTTNDYLTMNIHSPSPSLDENETSSSVEQTG